jgi:3-methylfumaryl-CoA hydratase
MLPNGLQPWIGSEQIQHDVATPSVLARLGALLDHAEPDRPLETVPPLGHWLFGLGATPQSDLAADGHPRLGKFLPPIPLSRRMWAAGEMEFLAPIGVGDTLRRRSTIRSIDHKKGRSGDLVFVTLDHEVYASSILAVRETQQLVYRDKPTSNAPPRDTSVSLPTPHWQRKVIPDPMLLFRFSALTFNSHRIHYDREYAVGVEGYPGLVVHGPLIATLLVDLFLLNHPNRKLTQFRFKAQEPLFDLDPFCIAGVSRDGTAQLWAIGPDQRIAMTAELTYT